LRGDDAGCTKPGAPPAIANGDVAAAQVDMLAAAFACDLTRVATLQIGIEGTTITHP
jgi:hypothetical protein